MQSTLFTELTASEEASLSGGNPSNKDPKNKNKQIAKGGVVIAPLSGNLSGNAVTVGSHNGDNTAGSLNFSADGTNNNTQDVSAST